MKNIIVIVGLLLALPGWAQTKVVKANAVKANDYGVTYSLPKTQLVVDAEVTKVSCKAGPYYPYAEKYLGVKNVVTEDEVYYELGKVTLVMNTPDVIMEFSGVLPNGKLSHGFYNFTYNSPLHGHLRASHCKSVYLVERPFMKRQTVSLQFINEAGHAMFKVFAGRDEKGELVAEQLAAMRSWFSGDDAGAFA